MLVPQLDLAFWRRLGSALRTGVVEMRGRPWLRGIRFGRGARCNISTRASRSRYSIPQPDNAIGVVAALVNQRLDEAGPLSLLSGEQCALRDEIHRHRLMPSTWTRRARKTLEDQRDKNDAEREKMISSRPGNGASAAVESGSAGGGAATRHPAMPWPYARIRDSLRRRSYGAAGHGADSLAG